MEGVSKKDVTEVVKVIRPIESLANKKGDKLFLATHEEKLAKLLKINRQTDSNLVVELKEHIASELELMPLLVLIKKLKGKFPIFCTGSLIGYSRFGVELGNMYHCYFGNMTI